MDARSTGRSREKPRRNGGIIDLRPDRHPKGDDLHTIKIGRMRQLERLGLAHQVGPGQWTLAENSEPTLRAAR